MSRGVRATVGRCGVLVVVTALLLSVAPPAAGTADVVRNETLTDVPVEESSTVTHQFTYTVENVSDDGDEDMFYVEFADAYEGSMSPNGESAESNGTNVSDTSSIEVVDGPDDDGVQETLRVGYSPDIAGETVDLNLSVDVDLSHPSVVSDTAYDVVVHVDDSDTGGVDVDTTAAPYEYTVQDTETLDAGVTEITGCGVVDSSGEYRLTQGVLDADTSPCIAVTASDVVVDGGGNAVDGTGIGDGTGVRVAEGVSNVTVRNLSVTEWKVGINATGTTDVTVTGGYVNDTTDGVTVIGATEPRVNETRIGNTTVAVDAKRTTGGIVTGTLITDADTNAVLAYDPNTGNATNLTVRDNGMYDIGSSAVYAGEGTGVRVVDNRINDTGYYGVAVSAGTNVTVSGNEINYTVANGVAAYETTNATVAGNRIRGGGTTYGISADDSTNVTVADNNITDVTVDGIGVAEGTRPTVVDNTVYRAGRHGVVAGLTTRGLVDGNTLARTDEAGIDATGATNLTIRHTNVTNASGGVVLERSHDTVVRNASIRNVTGGPGDAGIEVNASDRVTLLDNYVRNVTADGDLSQSERRAIKGINVTDSRNLTMRGNALVDNRNSAVSLTNATDTRIEDTVAVDNGEAALALFAVSNTSVVDTDADGNVFGIVVRDTTDTTLTGNVVTNTSNAAVDVLTSRNLTVRDGRFVNATYGVSADASPNLTVETSYLANSTDGVAVRRSPNLTVTDSEAANNSGYGVSFNGAPNATIAGNVLADNGVAGVGMNGSAGTTIRANEVTGSPSGILTAGSDLAIVGNTVFGAERGIWVGATAVAGFDGPTSHVDVRNNRLTRNVAGIRVSASNGPVNVTANRITLNDRYGIDADDFGGPLDVRGNLITDTAGVGQVPAGVYVAPGAPAEKLTLRRNAIANNSFYGVYSANTTTNAYVDARNNYWGGAEPSGTLGDPVTDAIADGDGDAISDGGQGISNVRFDPTFRLYRSLSLSESTVETDERVTVTATLQNPALIEDLGSVGLRVDGSEVDSTLVALGGDETRDVSFETSFGSAGEYTLTVGTRSTVLTVEAASDGTSSSRSRRGGNGGDDDPPEVAEEEVEEEEEEEVEEEEEIEEEDEPADVEGEPETVEEEVDEEGEQTTRVTSQAENVQEGDRVSMRTDTEETQDDEVAVESVEFTAETQQQAVSVTVTQSTQQTSGSPDFESDDGTEPSGYIDVDHDVSNEEVSGVDLDFRVAKDRLGPDDDPSDVSLYRAEEADGDVDWDELPTREVGETETHYVFEADSPGLSNFVVGVKQAQFQIADASISIAEVQVQQETEVLTRVTNTGGADGTFVVELVQGNQTVASRSLSIAANGTRQTTFDRTFGAAGAYDLYVNSVFVATVTVQEPTPTPTGTADGDATATATDTTPDSPAGGGDDGTTPTAAPATTAGDDGTSVFSPGFGPVAALAAVVALALLARRRA
jgi:PGF-pre-PGF domain-containing protein/PGF-CTERM protein